MQSLHKIGENTAWVEVSYHCTHSVSRRTLDDVRLHTNQKLTTEMHADELSWENTLHPHFVIETSIPLRVPVDMRQMRAYQFIHKGNLIFSFKFLRAALI